MVQSPPATDASDLALLRATPISRARMDLLWLDPPHLAALRRQVGADGRVTLAIEDGTETRSHTLTIADLDWAKRIEAIVDQGFAAGELGMYQDAIGFYREALALAPGCDLFLMSIGSALAMLGDLDAGAAFLARALEISPTNARIRGNYDLLQAQL